MKLSIISPTLNEAENVPCLVEQIGQALGDTDYELLIVDDDSPDRTWSVAHELSLTHPQVRVIRRMQNRSLSGAVIEGFRAAEGDALACIDADLQHDPSVLPEMLKELRRGSDVVIASRYGQGGGTERWSWFRRLQSRIATKMAQMLLGIKLTDPMSGYFLIWRKDFRRIQDDVDGKGFKILLEILAKLRPFTIREVPYTFRARVAGESKLSSRVIFQYLQQLWRLSRGAPSGVRALVPRARTPVS